MSSQPDEHTLDETITRLEAGLATVAGRMNVLHAELVELAAEALATGAWQGWQIHTPAHWLTLQLGVSTRSAKQVIRVAERIGEHPHLREVLATGALSLDQAEQVVRAPVWADQQVTDFATVATVAQLRRMVRDEHFTPDPDEPEPSPVEPKDRCSLGWDDHSRFTLSANLSAEDGAIVEAALAEARDALFRAAVDGERVGWVDALVEVARRSSGAAPVARRDRFMTFLHVHTDSGTVQFTNGVIVPDTVREYFACDGQMRPVWERDHTPVGVGRSQRIVPDRLRRLIEHRDQGCRIPGCANRLVEIHHLVHWSHGGPTESHNLASICHRHHRAIHKGLLTITGDADQADGLTFTDWRGQPLRTHATPEPPTGPPREPAQRYRHPTGERFDANLVDWTHPNARRRRYEQAQASIAARERRERERRDWEHQQYLLHQHHRQHW